MKLQRIFLLILTVPCLGMVVLHGDLPADRIETADGAILTGRIEDVSETHIQITTSYAGTLVVDRAVVLRYHQAGADALPAEAKTVKEEKKKTVPVAQVPKASNPVADDPRLWKFEAGLNFVGNQGNTDKIDLTITADAEMDREYDRLGIYGRYSYGENKGKLSANEIVLGSQYTNFFRDNLGFFLRGELEHDDREGILIRSTSASGISWKVKDQKDLTVETRSGISYRFEDFKDDGSADYPGMDFGLDLNWRFVEWARLKASYTYLPSVADFGDYIIRQDTGFNVPLDYSNLWELRLGVVSKYNNQPDEGRERLDHRYYARLIASWE
ncbi:MAG: YdiY family protein [Puniceicoccaceae bacterium]